MAFDRPTLSELVTRIRTDFENNLSTRGAVLKTSVVQVLSRVIAGATHLLHGHFQYLTNQIFPDTADAAFLDRIGNIWGITRNVATAANGPILITGQDGLTVPAGTVLTRSDAAEFTVNENVTISGGQAIAQVTASVAGTAGNTSSGAELSFQTPIENIDSNTTVQSDEIKDGTDTETDASLRSRIVDRIQRPPQGGAEIDYTTWALEVTGVTRAWVYPSLNGEGTVGVSFVRDNDDPIFPTTGDVFDVSSYIGERRPVTALHQVFAPTADPIDFTIDAEPFDSLVQENIESELQDLIFRDGEPGGKILLSRMSEAISQAQGETDNVLVSPTADFESPTGFLPTLGTISFV